MSKRLHIRKPSMFLPELTDEQITEACRLLTAYEVATIPPEDSYTEPYSDAYTAYIHELMANYKAGAITPAKVPMGWQYYTRRGIAAVLIAALLAGIAMPDKVMAGYRWLVEVVEEFFEGRKTEYRYTSNVDENVEFVPMKFGYLPEGMVGEVKVNERGNYKVFYLRSDNGKYDYFEIEQEMVKMNFLYDSNIEVSDTEILCLNNKLVKIVIRGEKFEFHFVDNNNFFSGHTNLEKDELIKIIENMFF